MIQRFVTSSFGATALAQSPQVTVIDSRFSNTFGIWWCSPGFLCLLHRCLCSPQLHPAQEQVRDPGSSDQLSCTTSTWTWSSRRSDGLDPIQPLIRLLPKPFQAEHTALLPVPHPQVQHSPALVLTHHFPSADAFLRAHLLPEGHQRLDTWLDEAGLMQGEPL